MYAYIPRQIGSVGSVICFLLKKGANHIPCSAEKQYGTLIATRNTLRKHAYSNILKILPSKNENFQIKNSDIFHTSAQNIDCGYSLEPPR